MTELDRDKTRGWSWQTYLFVGLVLSFFSVVAWPTLHKWVSARVDAKVEPNHPSPVSDAPPSAPPPREVGAASGPPVPAAPAPPAGQFRDVAIDEPFDAVFARSKTLMDTPQVREIILPGGRVGVVCVVQAKLHADTGAGRVEAEKVCQNRMAAAFLTWKQGLDTERVTEVTGPDERVDDRTRTAMKGHVRTLVPVGRWVSAKGDVFYMAFGEVLVPGKL